MADELDLQTQVTDSAARRDSGHNQNADMSPKADPDVEANLDLLLEEATGDKPPVVKDPSKPDENNEDNAEGDPAIPEPTAKETDGVSDAVGDGTEDGAASDESEEGAADSTQEDDLDNIELPPHTSPKAADSFAAIKEKAREQIQAAKQEAEALRAKVSEFETKAVVTPEEKAELENLRRFRAAAEIEKDPKFTAAFSDRIAVNDKLIYDKLTEAGMTAEQVEKVKKMGGPTNLSNWDAIYEHLGPTAKRIVDARLTENENLIRDRDEKLKAAKADVDKYIEENTVTSKTRLEAEAKAITETANELLTKVEWTVKQEIPKNASEAQKKAIEAANSKSDQHVATLKQLLQDRSPENHATLAFGTIQALHFRDQLEATKTELQALRAANKELEGKLSKIKKSGASARTGSAPAKPLKPSGDLFTTNVEDAIDNLRREVENNA